MKIICDFSVFYLDETLPKGSIVTECGRMLLHYGYRLKILNTILIKGLEDDTYSMTEVRTDSGYVLLKQDIEVVISQKESADSCTVYASDTLGLIQNDPRYAQIIQSDANLKNIPRSIWNTSS